jgi:hypothetical protein
MIRRTPALSNSYRCSGNIGRTVGTEPTDTQTVVLRLPCFLSRKDLVTLAIQDAHSNRMRRPLYICGGDDGGGRVRYLNLLLRQIRRTAVDRPANKLNPECPRLFRIGACGSVERIELWQRRARRGVDGYICLAGDGQCNSSPISCGSVLVLAFPTARFRISLGAKFAHERARDGAYSLNPLQLPKQPCKHVRPLRLDAGARLGTPVLATARRLPSGCAIFGQSR